MGNSGFEFRDQLWLILRHIKRIHSKAPVIYIPSITNGEKQNDNYQTHPEALQQCCKVYEKEVINHNGIRVDEFYKQKYFI